MKQVLPRIQTKAKIPAFKGLSPDIFVANMKQRINKRLEYLALGITQILFF